jgi:hypothetical protein
MVNAIESVIHDVVCCSTACVDNNTPPKSQSNLFIPEIEKTWDEIVPTANKLFVFYSLSFTNKP